MEELLEIIATLVDKADNFLELTKNNFMAEDMKYDAVKTGLTEIRDELKIEYLKHGGENVWE